MEIKEFVVNFADQFDETDPSVFSENTCFQDIGEWDSLMVLSIISMIKLEYGATVSGLDVNECETVSDVYALVENANG